MNEQEIFDKHYKQRKVYGCSNKKFMELVLSALMNDGIIKKEGKYCVLNITFPDKDNVLVEWVIVPSSEAP